MQKFTTLYLLFIALLFSANTIAQTYIPLPDTNVVWSVDTSKITVSGDTVLNAVSYNKYYVTADTSLAPNSYQLAGLVRQDSVNKKVFGILPGQSAEQLMYDFSLNVGDTITVYSIGFIHPGPNLVKVIAKDSVQINSTYRQRLTLTGYVYPNILIEYWTEGLGSSYGPLNPGLSCVCITDICYPNLLCQQQNGSIVYMNPLFNSCYYENNCTVGLHEKESNRIRLFPNPATDHITVDNTDAIKSVELYNVTGEKQTKYSFERNSKKIYFTHLPDGIYFLKITAADGVYFERFVLSQFDNGGH